MSDVEQKSIFTEVKTIKLAVHQNPLLNQDPSEVACFRWLPNAWPHCKPFFFTKTLQAGYALSVLGHFLALHTCV